MTYKKFFDPPYTQILAEKPFADEDPQIGDIRDGKIYIYTEKIVLAVNVAIVTGRPILVRGPSGCGKSSLARSVARYMAWRYYEEVISSRTQARDLLWRFDTLRRLNDAQANALQNDQAFYIEPGVLWWAFDRESARCRGQSSDAENLPLAIEPGDDTSHEQAVVLLDEIDKADPDVPNDLLVPLGSNQFIVQETRTLVRAKRSPLVFITTNEERSLPNAFLRRCVVLSMEPAGEERLVEIARAHFGDKYVKLYEGIINQIIKLGQDDFGSEQALLPSAAEYLDTILSCIKLEIKPDNEDEIWRILNDISLLKPRNLLGGL